MNGTIDAVRGMRDVLPADYTAQALVATRLERALALAGYQPIDLPILERRDLYLRKLGEELVGKVYEFSFNGRELALRPEWTASVLRAYVARMQEQALPLRLRYAGPVFRNERPQRATYRQFTQIGVELIGGPAPRADAECLMIACAGLDAAGVADYRVRIGHIGLIRAVLGSLGLQERTQGILAWSLERMREHGVDAVREQLDQEEEPDFDAALLEGLSDQQAEALLLRALGAIGVKLQFGTRPPEAIVQRLVRKLRREDQRPAIERALILLERLAQITGPPAQALPQAEALLREFALPSTGLDELRSILDLVVASGVPESRLLVDFGLGRGLHYYTGAIFEIYAGDLQLCGGGRYDDLVTTLGGRQATPAVGFAYGLERVALAVPAAAGATRPAEVLVVPSEDAAFAYAQRVAAQLRERGYIATVDVRGRNAATNARDAARRGTSFLAVVSTEQAETGELAWRDLASREERIVEIELIPVAAQ
ncbi:MAG: ATP phosphoribosyltransferase regulatory subunit [Roseiflexaceae bacterium]|nr:ATP phosphoribosyltransferase regulatory subunit [Roseiflexaceae bacterium]